MGSKVIGGGGGGGGDCYGVGNGILFVYPFCIFT